MRFADAVKERMPRGLVLPDAFAAAFDWAEANGQRMDASTVDGGDYLSIYPFDIMGTPGASDAPIMPDDFRAFLKNRFGVTPPTTAAALGIVIPDYNDMSDPMRQWLGKHMPQ